MEIEIRKLDVKTDERGWLVEILKNNELDKKEFGQIYITVAKPGYTKGKHYHKRKTEWFCVIRGKGELTLKDFGGETKKVILSEKELKLVKISPNVFHKIENTGKEDMHLLAYVDEQLNPEDQDAYYDEP